MRSFFTLSVSLFICCNLSAQSWRPKSFSQDFTSLYTGKELPLANSISLNQQEIIQYQQKNEGSPLVSFPVDINFNLKEDGKWFKLKDGNVWQLKLKMANAPAIALLLKNVVLPVGAYLHIYDSERKFVKRPFLAKDISDQQRLFSGLIPGEEVIIEYFEPLSVKGKGYFEVFRVDQVYETANFFTDPRFGTSLDCHTNINCEAGTDYRKEQLGICRIVMILEEGIGYCTGNLMNNTAEDQTPYILTGFHCQDGFTPFYDLWRFDFNFEATGCGNPAIAPDFQSISSCQQRAGRQENDMLLLELNEKIPASYQVYYLGWDRIATPPNRSANIHHPLGDIKKITHFYTPATILNTPINWNNDVQTPANHHFSISFNDGTFETGSSGSALLNPEGKVVGHLHGGNPTCEASIGYFSRFHLDWTGGGTSENRLSDWLDPLNLDSDTLGGLEPEFIPGGSITGQVKMEDDRGIPNINVQLISGSNQATTSTDENGNFSFANVPFNEDYQISLVKNEDSANGVSLGDLVAIQKHILRSELLDSPYKMIAADADGSGNISLADIITLQKIILRRERQFQNVTSWQFLPNEFQFTDSSDPFGDTLPQFFLISDFVRDRVDINFVGLKTGDVTGDVLMR